jgi:hypothetical protein
LDPQHCFNNHDDFFNRKRWNDPLQKIFSIYLLTASYRTGTLYKVTLKNFKGLSQDREQVEHAGKLCAFNKDLSKLHRFNPDPSLCSGSSVPVKKAEKQLESCLGEELDPEMYQKLRIRNACYTYGTISVFFYDI